MILNRQLRALLKRLGLEESKAPSTTQWVSLLSYLNDHFRVNEDEKHRLNRSLEIHGREIQSLYKELVLERERLSSAIGCLQIGFVIFDKAGQVSLMNAEAEQYLGWSEFEASSRDLMSQLGLHELVDMPLALLLKSGQSLSGGFALQTKSGELYETNLQLQPILRDGVLVGSVLTFDTEEASAALAQQHRLDQESLSATLQDFIERLSMWLDADPGEVVSRHLSSLLHRTEEVLGVASRRKDGAGNEMAPRRESKALTSGERTQEEQPAIRETSVEVVMAEAPTSAFSRDSQAESRPTSTPPAPRVKPPSPALSAAVKSATAERAVVDVVSAPKTVPTLSVSRPPAPPVAKIEPDTILESRAVKDSEILSEIPILFTSEELERQEEPRQVRPMVEPPPMVAPPVVVPRAVPAPPTVAPPIVAPPPPVILAPPIVKPSAVASSVAPITPTAPVAAPSQPMPSLSELTAAAQPAKAAAPSLGTTIQENRPKPASKDLPLRVLLVEDEPVSQLVTQSQLGQLGHECTVAGDANEAIRLYQHQPFDAVISSYLMPGMNGIELCRKIRDDARGGYTYFILLTAVERKDEAAKALEAGVDAFLTKPLDPNELAIRLKVARGVQSRLNRVYSELPDQRG